MILTWIVYHRRICWYHGVLLIAYYLVYVIVVVMGAYRFPGAETPVLPEPKSMHTTQELLSETSRLLSSSQEGKVMAYFNKIECYSSSYRTTPETS